ncbi:MAG: hypothetical protein QM640_03610 [Niabella sp.]
MPIRHTSLRTIKFVLPVTVLVLSSIAFFAFGENKPTKKSNLLFSTLTFKYQPSTYTEPQVESQSNWSLVDPEDACVQEDDDAACSFSITVPTGNESLYLNGSQPSSRVLIEASQSATSSNHYVSALKENITGTPALSGAVSNIIP